jgi:putative tricarboxylic transport membrane protein
MTGRGDAGTRGRGDREKKFPRVSVSPFLRVRVSPDAITGAAIALCAGWFLWQAAALREGPGYAAVGPRVFPAIVGVGFLVSGLALFLSGLRGARRQGTTDADAERHAPTDWPTLLAMAGLLALYLVLFRPLGFILASAGFLVAGAWALGSRAWARDLVAGALVSIPTYVVFARLLGLELPAGPLEGPLRAFQVVLSPSPGSA